MKQNREENHSKVYIIFFSESQPEDTASACEYRYALFQSPTSTQYSGIFNGETWESESFSSNMAAARILLENLGTGFTVQHLTQKAPIINNGDINTWFDYFIN